jgi:hypothetical protein
MSKVLIAFPETETDLNKEYKTYFKYAYYNFLECIEKGEEEGFDFSEDKKILKNIFDKIMNYGNINL